METNSQMLIMAGGPAVGTVTSLGEFEIKGRRIGRLGGVLCLHSTANDPDATSARDFFDDTTEFKMTEGMTCPVYFHHGLDAVIGVKELGQARLFRTARGVEIEADIYLDDADGRKCYQDALDGKLGWSSGTAAHLVQRQRLATKSGFAHRIKFWPLGLDASLTPKPAEPRNIAVAIKSLLCEVKTEGPFEFSSTQCNLSEDAADIVRNWTHDRINDSVLAKSGREIMPHITVLYGLHADNAEAVKVLAEGFGEIGATIGNLDVFEGKEHDVVVLGIDSPDLHRLHGRLSTLPHTSTFPTYQPHITLAYVKAGEGKQFQGPGPLTGEVLLFDGFAFSDKNGQMVKVPTIELGASAVGGAKYDPNQARDEDGKFAGGAANLSARGERPAHDLTPDEATHNAQRKLRNWTLEVADNGHTLDNTTRHTATLTDPANPARSIVQTVTSRPFEKLGHGEIREQAIANVAGQLHRRAVEKAVADGVPIGEHILRHYSHLKPENGDSAISKPDARPGHELPRYEFTERTLASGTGRVDALVQGDENTRQRSDRTHRTIVEAAIERGHYVPREVLRDYPDLAQRAQDSVKSGDDPDEWNEADWADWMANSSETIEELATRAKAVQVEHLQSQLLHAQVEMLRGAQNRMLI